MNTYILLIAAIFIIAVSVFAFQTPVHAGNLQAEILGQVDAGAKQANLVKADPRREIAYLIQVALGLVGSIFLVLILMSGFWYVTARGDESKVEKATKTVRGAIIGIVIVMFAYTITRFVSRATLEAVREPDVRESIREGQQECNQWYRPRCWVNWGDGSSGS